jgi:outer membrane protein
MRVSTLFVASAAALLGRSEGFFQNFKRRNHEEGKMKKLLLTLLLMLAIAVQPALALEKFELGLGAGAAPDYEGSEDYEAVPIPYVRANWASGQYVNLLGNKLKGNLLPDKMWSVGPMLQYIGKRDNVDNGRVDDMQSVDASIMLGAFGGVNIESWNINLEARQDVADGNGFLLTLNVNYDLPINDQWKLGFGASTTYASGDYMNAYFTVDSGDAARSGLSQYNADGGFKDFGLNMNTRYNFYENWSLMGLASYTRLVGDAADSPVVEDEGDENQFFAGVLVVYSF